MTHDTVSMTRRGQGRTAAGSPTYCFLIGGGRCGSTLVHEVLARHPDIGFISNLEDRFPQARILGRWNKVVYQRIPPWLTDKGRLRYAPSEGWRVLERQVSPMLSTPVRDLRADDAMPWLSQRFREFFERRAAAQGTPVFVHKFTGWPRTGFVERILPGAKFVRIVRDGRAVANSVLKTPWWRGYEGPTRSLLGPLPQPYETEWEASNRSFALLAGLEWKLLMDAFEAAEQAARPGSWLTVRYEDVVADPRRWFGEMLTFLGLEWTRAFERGFTRHHFNAARAEAFRADLDPASLRLLEESLAAHLARYGYG
ncbi:MAG: sulfotransferase family protein [Egibacteraceae bacterium]